MFRVLSYKTGSFPTGVSTLLLTLPVLTGERSQTYIKYRKPLCKAVFAHSLDILRLNYRHSRNLRHHSISLQYAFTRKIYYTAFRCGIQAFFEIPWIEFSANFTRIFMQFDEWYCVQFFRSYSVTYKCWFDIYDRISDAIRNALQLFWEGRAPHLRLYHFRYPIMQSIVYTKKDGHSLHHDRLSFSLSLCVTPPLCYLSSIANSCKGGICRAPRAPAVLLSVGYHQHFQRRNLPCPTVT